MSVAARRQTLQLLAPAKVNLYLHVTGRREDGYHTLDSLIAFADIGDMIHIAPATDFTFTIDGPFAKALDSRAHDASPDSANLAVRAAWALSRAVRRNLNVHITLTKNLPVAAGIGGGSSDAAAVIWGLMEWWDLPRPAGLHDGPAYLAPLLLALGADVPVCFACQPTRISGIGDELTPVGMIDEMPVVLVNPLVPCPTGRVFSHYAGPYHDIAPTLPVQAAAEPWHDFLATQRNDLAVNARAIVPEIAAVLAALEDTDGVKLVRLCGSGASCFALYEDEEAANRAAEGLRSAHRNWWVAPAMLNRAVRY